MFVSIYSLSDPRTDAVRYIGKTQQKPISRLYRHLVRARSGSGSDVSFWLRSLLSEGLRPTLQVLEEVSESDGSDREKFWIQDHLVRGAKLTNMTQGGYGSLGYKHSEAYLRKIREARAKQVITPEHREAIRRTNLERGITLPIGAQSLPRPGKTLTAVHKQRISESLIGKSRPQEVCDKISATRRKMFSQPASAAQV